MKRVFTVTRIFEKEGVDFTISSVNLTEEAFLTVLQELCGEQQEKQ